MAAADNKTKGVLIIVRRILNISIQDRNGDNAGRITYIKTVVENRKIAFLLVYTPCSPDPTFVSKLSTYLTDLMEIVKGTDMNHVMSHDLDRWQWWQFFLFPDFSYFLFLFLLSNSNNA